MYLVRCVHVISPNLDAFNMGWWGWGGFVWSHYNVYELLYDRCYMKNLLGVCLYDVLQDRFHMSYYMSVPDVEFGGFYMRNLLGWLETRLARITFSYIKLD